MVNMISCYSSVSVLNIPAVSSRRQRKGCIVSVIEVKWKFGTIKGFGSITISALIDIHFFFMKPVLQDVPKQWECLKFNAY